MDASSYQVSKVLRCLVKQLKWVVWVKIGYSVLCCLFVYCFGSRFGVVWVGSSGFNFALTSLCLREGFVLYAITGGDGKTCFNFYWWPVFLEDSFDSVYIICEMSGKMSLTGCWGLYCHCRFAFLLLKEMSLKWLIIWLFLSL